MALQLEPLYLPGLLNLADTYRVLGRDAEAGPLLQRAVQIAPDSGAANHSLGLYLVRHQQNAQALRYLAAAVEQADASPRYAYIYGVALENAGRIDEAIQVLFAADQRWPGQYDILLTLVSYLEKAGRTDTIRSHVEKLRDLAPASPDVQRLVARYFQ